MWIKHTIQLPAACCEYCIVSREQAMKYRFFAKILIVYLVLVKFYTKMWLKMYAVTRISLAITWICLYSLTNGSKSRKKAPFVLSTWNMFLLHSQFFAYKIIVTKERRKIKCLQTFLKGGIWVPKILSLSPSWVKGFGSSFCHFVDLVNGAEKPARNGS